MSDLGYLNDNTPLFIRAYGTDQVYYNQLDNPPLAILDRSLQYDINGEPYYNGQRLLLAGDGLTGATGPSGLDGPTGPSGSSLGDVVGPASSTDDAIVRYDGTSGKLIQDSSLTLDDDGFINNVQGIRFSSPIISTPYFFWKHEDGVAFGSTIAVSGPWGASKPDVPWSVDRSGGCVMLSIGPAIGLNDGPSSAIIGVDFGFIFTDFVPTAERHGTVLVRDAGVDKIVSYYIANSLGQTLQISRTFSSPSADSFASFPNGSTGQTGFPNSIMLHYLI